MTKIYVPVSVKDEQPKGKVVCIAANGQMMVGEYNPERGWCDDGTQIMVGNVTRWLKEVELPDPVSLKLSVADLNPYRERAVWWDAWNRGLIEGIKSVLNLLTPNNNEQEK